MFSLSCFSLFRFGLPDHCSQSFTLYIINTHGCGSNLRSRSMHLIHVAGDRSIGMDHRGMIHILFWATATENYRCSINFYNIYIIIFILYTVYDLFAIFMDVPPNIAGQHPFFLGIRYGRPSPRHSSWQRHKIRNVSCGQLNSPEPTTHLWRRCGIRRYYQCDWWKVGSSPYGGMVINPLI